MLNDDVTYSRGHVVLLSPRHDGLIGLGTGTFVDGHQVFQFSTISLISNFGGSRDRGLRNLTSYQLRLLTVRAAAVFPTIIALHPFDLRSRRGGEIPKKFGRYQRSDRTPSRLVTLDTHNIFPVMAAA